MPNMIEIRRERILMKPKFIKEWKTFIDKKRKKEGGEKVVDEKSCKLMSGVLVICEDDM